MSELEFIDNKAINDQNGKYTNLTVDVAKIVESWRISLYSYEWILPSGAIKSTEELSETEKPKRIEIEKLLSQNKPLEKPILGIGLLENVEIGAGRATFLTLAAHGIKTIPVHVRKNHADDFEAFCANLLS